MPDLRAIAIAIGVGGGAGGYVTLWWHWPLAIGGGIGLVLGGLALVGTMSVARDPSIADRAWQESAPEFVDPPAEPGPATPARPSTSDSAATTVRSRDLPSGD
jgi:hypothetical protein